MKKITGLFTSITFTLIVVPGYSQTFYKQIVFSHTHTANEKVMTKEECKDIMKPVYLSYDNKATVESMPSNIKMFGGKESNHKVSDYQIKRAVPTVNKNISIFEGVAQQTLVVNGKEIKTKLNEVVFFDHTKETVLGYWDNQYCWGSLYSKHIDASDFHKRVKK